MEGRRTVSLDSHKLDESTPEVRGEDRITIADEDIRKAMNPDHILEEQRRDVWSRHGFSGRDEDRLLVQAVHNDKNSFMVLARGKISDSIEGDTGPRPGRDRKGGNKSEGSMSHHLIAAARVTSPDIALHFRS